MKTIWLFGVLIIVVLISGCTGQEKAQQPVISPTSAVVEIKNSSYDPANITISKGTTVTWTQSDDLKHTVTSVIGTYEPTHQRKVLDSTLLSKGQIYSYTFNETGTFEYFCMIHPNMKGKVIVM